MKRIVRSLLIVLIVFALLFLLLATPFIAAYIWGQVRDHRIRNEVFEYVIERQAELEQGVSGSYENFVYTTRGLAPTSSTEYGFFYSISHVYGKHCYKYKNGYRMDDYLGDEVDWYYEEQICENWYYYEIHDG